MQQPVSALRSLFEGKTLSSPTSSFRTGRSHDSRRAIKLGLDVDTKLPAALESQHTMRESLHLLDTDTGLSILPRDGPVARAMESKMASSSMLRRSISLDPSKRSYLPSSSIGEALIPRDGTEERHHTPQVNDQTPSTSMARPLSLKAPPIPPPRGQHVRSTLRSRGQSSQRSIDSRSEMPSSHQQGDHMNEGTTTAEIRSSTIRVHEPQIPPGRLSFTTRSSLQPTVRKMINSTSPLHTPSCNDGIGQDIDSKVGLRLSKASEEGCNPELFQSKEHQPICVSALDRNSKISRPKPEHGVRPSHKTHSSITDRPKLPPRRPLSEQRRSPNGPVHAIDSHILATLPGVPKTYVHSGSVSSGGNCSPKVPPRRIPQASLNSVTSPQTLPESSRSLAKHHSARSMGSDLPGNLNTDHQHAQGLDDSATSKFDYPDTSYTNRRAPYYLGVHDPIVTDLDARIVDICGGYVCSSGHVTKVWDITSGKLVLDLCCCEKDTRVTAVAFKASADSSVDNPRLWLGTDNGEIQEVDIMRQCVADTKSGLHSGREIIKIYRHHSTMWTLDNGGRLCSWPAVGTRSSSLQENPTSYRLPRGQSVSIVIDDTLWYAIGKDIRLYHLMAHESSHLALPQELLTQPKLGAVTAVTTIDNKRDRVYFGHADGKISVYSTESHSCVGVISVSNYKIVSLTGVGLHLWAGYNTGMIYVYDTRTQPWSVKKEWQAHRGSPVLDIAVDPSCLWKYNQLCVASIGSDSTLRLWDGTLENDWLGESMISWRVF